MADNNKQNVQKQQQQQNQKEKSITTITAQKMKQPLGRAVADSSAPGQRKQVEQQRPQIVRRALSKLNRKRRRLRSKISESCVRLRQQSWPADDQRTGTGTLDYADRQNSVGTLDLFKYALRVEKLAVALGVLFMWYAASWQPISVFILAIMASLMGDYSKQQQAWLQQLNELTGGGDGSTGGHAHLAQTNSSSFFLSPFSQQQHTVSAASAAAHASSELHTYEGYHFLAPLYSLVVPIFAHFTTDTTTNQQHQPYLPTNSSSLITSSGGGGNDDDLIDQENIRAALHDILRHQSNQFLRKSFEINGSAFLLALSQLLAFFIGLNLITWAAKKQASRLKILYFNSCLHQEVTWFEAIDSASGSGSSLNALVDKYEDGIGMKLALLSYFFGHVALFACTAFYQMFSLAAFCMPFVLVVGIVIALLSERQARSIGQQALFAKRSLQLAEEILAAIRTVLAFNGQEKEIARYSISLEPVYRRSLIKHLYTALNTSLSKFSIFASFAAYCFYAMRLFPPYAASVGPDDDDHEHHLNKSTVLAVMRGAEVSIVNILISIPFMEALQQSKGSIARIYAAIERRSKINASSSSSAGQRRGQQVKAAGLSLPDNKWQASISFRMVQFGYADRSGPTSSVRRRSTVPFLELPADLQALSSSSTQNQQQPSGFGTVVGVASGEPNLGRRRQSLIEDLANELEMARATRGGGGVGHTSSFSSAKHSPAATAAADGSNNNNKEAAAFHTKQMETSAPAIERFMGGELEEIRRPKKRILSYFNLEIKPGQSVALVGPSGSGKSTVLSLVQRLYDITGGQLLIGGHSIKDLNVSWLRNQIGVVAQEPRLFDMSIGENIRLGLSAEHSGEASWMVGDNGDDLLLGGHKQHRRCDEPIINEAWRAQQVIEAAKAAGAHDFIARLPEGYGTRVGVGGVQLSGGQKQRIAIARALIRKPKILLLDECTSALDSESEKQVQRALKEASEGRTTLTVAHRLETIKHVDLIVVMYQGQVVECGTHEELMMTGDCGASADNGSCPTSERGVGGRSRVAGIYKQMYEDQLASARAASGATAVTKTPARHPLDRDDDDEEKEETTKRTKQQVVKQAHERWAITALGGLKEKEVDYDDDDDEDYNLRRHDCKGAGKKGGVASFHSNSTEECKDLDEDYDSVEYEDDDDDDDDDCDSYAGSSSSSSISEQLMRANFWQLWHFIEMPKWSSMAACFVCLLAGLILPLNLIAHSYLFSAFAYSEPEQLSECLHIFGLVILSFSSFVFIVSFLQIILPGYAGEKLSSRLRTKTMRSLLEKPMFYFDMDSNSAGSLCDRFNSYISNIQSIAGTRVATMLEALSTLAAGAFFGFGQNFTLSSFCLSFALLVLLTTIIESRLVQQQSSLEQKYDAKLAHLMADALSNIKTVASLNKEKFFISRFSEIIRQREVGRGKCVVLLRTFLTSLKFIMPAMSWSASMFFGCKLLVEGRIDLQTIFIVCPVVLFAVNDTFRALVFLPELLKARKSIERLYKMNREFSPEVLQQLTFGQQLEQQNQLHLEQQQNSAAANNPTSGCHTSSSQGMSIALMNQLNNNNSNNGMDGKVAGQQHSQQQRKSLVTFVVPKREQQQQQQLDAGGICMDLDGGMGVAAAAAAAATPTVAGNQQQQVNRRLSTIGQLPTYMRRKSSRLNSLIPSKQSRGRIEFTNVEFAYPNRPSALVLDSFSLSVQPGESVALVGGSGSGKSTCVAILEKFYDYHAGRVTLDGHDLRVMESNWTRQQIGLVSQEPTLLSYTIGDNIRYGDNSRFVSMDEVVEAARTANIHDFIMSLPDQYDTELSNSACSSCQLSGGQRQRIAIARALIRNAPILIFDEATSALDSRNESVVQDALNKARKGRTSLTIAHRLSTVKEADKIAVLGDGRVLEVGRHSELMLSELGHYRKLWLSQVGDCGDERSSFEDEEDEEQKEEVKVEEARAENNKWKQEQLDQSHSSFNIERLTSSSSLNNNHHNHHPEQQQQQAATRLEERRNVEADE